MFHWISIQNKEKSLTRAPRGTDRSPEYNEQLEKAPHWPI